MSHLNIEPTTIQATPLERSLASLCTRLGADRWLLCRYDDGEWNTQATHALPRDHVYLAVLGTIGESAGWSLVESSEISGAGPRLQVAGVGLLAVLGGTLRGRPAIAIFENPDRKRVTEVFSSSAPPEFSDMPHLIEGDGATLPADDRWDAEMRGLWGLLPIFGTLVSGTVDAHSVIERTAQALDARALVALTPTPTGISAIVAVKARMSGRCSPPDWTG